MEQIRILVVEDESIVAMDIKHRLESLDYKVPAIISSGEEAVIKAKETRPDLVLMDIVLKGELDGIDAAQLIKDKYDIPVVYLTAYSDEKTLKRAKITGPFGYIIKPFEDRELHSAIEIALYKHKMESKLKQNEMWLSTTLESIGDAVITTDKYGHITFMNPIAQKITEWDLNNALGKPLEDVFKIIDEETNYPIKYSVKDILLNDVTHLKDQALLITKSGTNVPIDNTSAPIKDYKDNINGIVLVFQDISKRKKSEKEREKLLKESARSELFSFLLSAMPVFASNIPPQIRNNIAKSFGDRFETNMKPRFEKSLDIYSKEPSDNFERYLTWISEFLSNLGIETEIFSKENTDYIRFLKCPWEIDNEYSPMFCLICRVIIMRSFTWTNIKGNVEQISCLADGKEDCIFEFMQSNNY